MDHLARLISTEDSEQSPEEQRLLDELRGEHRRLRFRLVTIEIIGIALSRGIFTPDIAADVAGVSTFPPCVVTAACEWRVSRYGRPAA